MIAIPYIRSHFNEVTNAILRSMSNVHHLSSQKTIEFLQHWLLLTGYWCSQAVPLLLLVLHVVANLFVFKLLVDGMIWWPWSRDSGWHDHCTLAGGALRACNYYYYRDRCQCLHIVLLVFELLVDLYIDADGLFCFVLFAWKWDWLVNINRSLKGFY